jgi:non-specific serine/threonine protein kinase
MLLTYSAAIPLLRGEYARAEQLSREGLALAREMGDRIGIYASLYSLALVARTRGDDAESAGLIGEALRLSVEMGDRGNVAYCLEGLAGIAVAERKLEQAATLWGAAEALLDGAEAAVYVHTPDRATHAQAVASARARLDPETWNHAWNNGRAMSLDQAVSYALGRDTSG